MFIGRDIAIAIGGDRVWFARGRDAPVISCPAYVATAGGKVVAVGEEAQRMRGKEPGNIRVTRVTFQGGFGDGPLAEAFLRYLIRKHSGSRLFGIAPRAIAVCPGYAKIAVRNTAIQTGVRELLTIEPAMAAAIGAGLQVEEPDFKAVLVLERDWCAFGLISLAGLVASFDLVGGIELLLEDFALHALATRSVALDLEALHTEFLARGWSGAELLGWDAWIGELETGRAAVMAVTEDDFRRGSLPFLLRLGWRYQQAMAAIDNAQRRDTTAAPLHLFGPYTRTPGVADFIARAFQRRVILPEKPEEAAIRGARIVLTDLRFLLPKSIRQRQIQQGGGFGDPALQRPHCSAPMSGDSRLSQPGRRPGAALEEPGEERRRRRREADDLVRRLAIELEVELGLGPAVVPVGLRPELGPSQAPPGAREAPDGDAHPRGLPGDPRSFREGPGRGDNPARDESRPALVLAREDEDRIARGDGLAAIHRLLRVEDECRRPRVGHLRFDHERLAPHLIGFPGPDGIGQVAGSEELNAGMRPATKTEARSSASISGDFPSASLPISVGQRFR